MSYIHCFQKSRILRIELDLSYRDQRLAWGKHIKERLMSFTVKKTLLALASVASEVQSHTENQKTKN